MADWVATEDFEYSVGGLNGNNGGTGWSGAWSTDAGLTVVSSPTFSGTGACKVRNTVGGGDGDRSLTTGVTSGICRLYVYAGTVPTGTTGYYPALFRDGTTIKFAVEWGATASSSGNVIAFSNLGGSAVTLSSGPTAATWYYIDVEFDQANNRARASFNGGAWSSYVTANGGSFTSITNYRITNADSGAGDNTYLVDNIGVGTGPGVAARLFTLLGVGT